MGILSFLGVSCLRTSENKYERLTPELKTELRGALKRNPDINFNLDYIRTTNLEFEILNTYGFDGVRFLFETNNSANFYELGNFPEDCPWYGLNDENNTDFIETNFQSVSKELPKLLNELKNRCRFIYAEKKTNTWQLHYLLAVKLYDQRDYFTVYTGGEPIAKVIPNENLLTYHWDVPVKLRTFYTIHNGFGTLNDANFIVPNSNLKVMATLMDTISEKQNARAEGYQFKDLLEFFPDGSGNVQCFYKNDNDQTVDWDHETWEISAEIGFFEFIDYRMSQIDEE